MGENNNDFNKKLGLSKAKLSGKIRDNIQKVAIFAVSIVYVFQGLFSFVERDSTVLEILGNIALSVIVGVVISSSLNSMGLRDGRRSEVFINSTKAYGEAKGRATPMLDSLPKWCRYKNADELEQAKKNIILSAGLSWKAFKFGYYDEHNDKLDDEQKEALQRAKNCKILEFAYSNLLSDSEFSNNTGKGVINKIKGKFYGRFGRGEKDYLLSGSVGDFASRIFTGIVCGLYMLVPAISGAAMAKIVWNTLQVALWLGIGILKYSNAKYFMENEYRQTHIIMKTEYLNEFIATMENHPEVIEQDVEEIAINKYIDEWIKSKENEQVLVAESEKPQIEQVQQVSVNSQILPDKVEVNDGKDVD